MPVRLQVLLGLLGDVARVAGIPLAGDGILHAADHAQRRDLEDRVDEGRLRVGEEQHVALLDLLVAPDARPVEPEPVAEHVVRQLPGREREVLPHARKVHEPQIDDLDLGILRELLHVVGRFRHDVPPSRDVATASSAGRQQAGADFRVIEHLVREIATTKPGDLRRRAPGRETPLVHDWCRGPGRGRSSLRSGAPPGGQGSRFLERPLQLGLETAGPEVRMRRDRSKNSSVSNAGTVRSLAWPRTTRNASISERKNW